MQKLRTSKSKGFTIIEVLIVLAIAGLIMVVVFLAVPALQRNARNNALSTDANNLLSGVSTFVSNNNGTLPTGPGTAAAPNSSYVSITGATGTNSEQVKVGTGIATFVVGGTAMTTTSIAGGQNAAATPVGTVQLITGPSAVCNSTSTGLSGTGSARSYAILYVAEGANGSRVLKCIGG